MSRPFTDHNFGTAINATPVTSPLVQRAEERLEQTLVPNNFIAIAITTIGTTAVALPMLLSTRKRLLIQNTSTETIALGGDNTVTLTTGYLVNPGNTFTLPVGDAISVYVITDQVVQIITLELA